MVKRTRTIRRQQPTNCLSVFDLFVGLVLKGLIFTSIIVVLLLPANTSFNTYTILVMVKLMVKFILSHSFEYQKGYFLLH